jgi:hypothetical protein
MSKKTSLLSAALSGQPAAPAASAAPPKPSLFKPLLDNYAFPCLVHAPDDGTPVPDVSELADGLDSIDLKEFTVVGSAPTRTSLPNGTPLVRGEGLDLKKRVVPILRLWVIQQPYSHPDAF